MVATDSVRLLVSRGIGAAGRTSMPDEGSRHARTWMAFGVTSRIWGRELLPVARKNLCDVAAAIARFEPVSMLVRTDERKIVERLCSKDVTLTLVDAEMDDCWMRDTGPVFVTDERGALHGINFNFNGWGGKQQHALDAKVALVVAAKAGASLISPSLVLEGGGIEVDGHGSAIVTESCVLNGNRNPGLSKAAVEKQLMHFLGLTKIIWLPGISGIDITDCHTDFYARFAGPGVVVSHYEPDPEAPDHELTKIHLDILRTSTDAQGRPLKVHILEAPNYESLRWDGPMEEFAAGYVNFYLVNGAVIVPEFGDARTDAAAVQTLTDLFPEHEIVPVNIDGIAAGGGGIHCVTQQEPMCGAWTVS